MTKIEELEQELARREALENESIALMSEGDLLSAALLMYKQSPAMMIDKSSDFSRLMELDGKRKAQQAVSKPIDEMNFHELADRCLQTFAKEAGAALRAEDRELFHATILGMQQHIDDMRF